MTKMGRPPRAIPRRQRHIYMTDETYCVVKQFCAASRSRNVQCSFSDGIERMIEIAAHFEADPQFQPATQVLGSLPGAAAPYWIRIDANHGRRVRCTVCNETYEVPATRFAGVIKGIATFVEAHSRCGGDEAEGEGTT